MRFSWSVLPAIGAISALFTLVQARSQASEAIRQVTPIDNPIIRTQAHQIDHLSHFDLTFELHRDGQRIKLELEPNHDILADDAYVQYVGADGKWEGEPIHRHEHRVFRGRALVGSGKGRWTPAGWARITVRQDGAEPLFEGAFSIDQNKHHIELQSTYLAKKRPIDIDIEHRSGDYMIVYRDTDMLRAPSELKRSLADSTSTGCSANRLDFNADLTNSIFPFGLEQPDSQWGIAPLNSLFGLGLSKRDDVGGVTGNTAGVNLRNTVGDTSGCPKTKKVALIGVATDCEMTNYFKSNSTPKDAAKDWVINLVNTASSLYEDSFNISIGLRNLTSQPEHATLLIPGPIEFDDDVLKSMGHYSESHVGPGFVNTFGETLSMTRKLFQSTDPSAQPYIISGSGTLGWDIVAANLVEAGEDALVLSTGYFGDGFADCLRAYGANVTKLDGEVGGRPQLPEIEKALFEKKYKILTVTHVDTSTGVLSELKNLAATVKRVSPETLVIVDGVCSVACEEIAFDEWGLDGVVTASQKAIGVPAGLSISFFSGRAVAAALENRKTPIPAYFASMKNWTPIMKNYEAKKPSYFATPSPQLVHALHTSLTQILSKPLSERFQGHIEVSNKVKKAITDLGLKIVATKPEDQAHAMTAIYLPEGVGAPDVLPKLAGKGVVFAGGIHKAIASKYIRFGHMGVSALDPSRNHMEKAINALKESLFEAGYKA